MSDSHSKRSSLRKNTHSSMTKRSISETDSNSTDKKRTKTSQKSPLKRASGDNMPFPRSQNLKMFVGAHVSSAKGVFNSITNADDIGGNAFALFVKPQRRWTSPPLKEEEIKQFASLSKEYNYSLLKHVLPHGSYLINLANLDEEKNKQAYNAFLDELQRCESLGIHAYNLHPGSALTYNKKDAIAKLAFNINKGVGATKFVKVVLENMAGQGNIIGSTFEDLRDVIDLIEDKSRVGVCIDTCHTFASGIDIRTEDTYKMMWESFDKIIGLKYLAGIHLNDSKAPLGANRDLHQNIGLGFLGLESFRVLMNTKIVEDLPMILETPNNDDVTVWAKEIKLLEWLIGKSEDDPAFIKKRDELSARGASERKTMELKYDQKQKSKRKSKKRKAADASDTDS
ncbi:xylose isomerase-like protein [Dipodascopsis uninucleata]